jgi:hypothetical protein
MEREAISDDRQGSPPASGAAPMRAAKRTTASSAMKNTIYVQLLGEGVLTFRPVTASQVAPNIYVIEGYEAYDPEDEEWEFLPGDRVVVENKFFGGELILVAVSQDDSKTS